MRPRLLSRAHLALLAGVLIAACSSGNGGGTQGHCVNSLDCTLAVGKPVCDKQIGECVACVAAADCPANNDCTAHQCVPFVPCAGPSDCLTGRVCDTTAGRCVECVADGDCGAEKQCAGNVCRPVCASDTACTPLGLLCDTAAGHCVQCVLHADCKADQYCAAGQCKPDECRTGQTACIAGGLATCKEAGEGFGTPQPCASGSCVVAALGPVCEAGGTDGGPSDAEGSDGGGSDSPPAGPCTSTASDYDCTAIPRFPVRSTSQVLDGIGDEFAAVRPVTFTAMNAPFREGHFNGDPAPAKTFPEEITFRAAWSPEAFHMHVRVTDTALHVGGAGALWDGDTVDFMLAASDTFTYAGDGTCGQNAVHFRIAPSATLASEIAASGTGSAAAVPTDWYALRILPAEAYEIELRVPWPGGVAPTGSGAKIGFHLGVSIQDAATGGRELWVTLPVDGTLALGGGCVGFPREQAWCDGNAWCRPTLLDVSCP